MCAIETCTGGRLGGCFRVCGSRKTRIMSLLPLLCFTDKRSCCMLKEKEIQQLSKLRLFLYVKLKWGRFSLKVSLLWIERKTLERNRKVYFNVITEFVWEDDSRWGGDNSLPLVTWLQTQTRKSTGRKSYFLTAVPRMGTKLCKNCIFSMRFTQFVWFLLSAIQHHTQP